MAGATLLNTLITNIYPIKINLWKGHKFFIFFFDIEESGWGRGRVVVQKRYCMVFQGVHFDQVKSSMEITKCQADFGHSMG